MERNLPVEERKQLHFFSPEELFAFIQAIEINDPKPEQTVRGYKVNHDVPGAECRRGD